MNAFRRPSAAGLLTLIVIFEMSAAALLCLKTTPFDYMAVFVGLLTSALLIFQYCILTSFFKHIDRYVLIISNVLAGIGIIAQYRINPDLAVKQLIFLGVGMLAMVVVMLIIRRIDVWEKGTWWIMVGSILILCLSFVIGRVAGGARNWINVFGFSLQPSEFVKITTIFVASIFLSRKQKLHKLWPFLLYIAACLLILVMQKDLGAAILYALTSLIMFYVATNNLLFTGIGAGLGVGGAILSYHVFDHVKTRVEVWQNPWIHYNDSGYQIVQGLIALASGGIFGMGLTKGSPMSIPVRESDYIFAVICEEFGILFGIAVLAFYLVFIIRGASIALKAHNTFHALLALGCTCMITLQSFAIVGGIIKLIPLTGVTLPFVSAGGSSMLSCMMLVGILQGVAQRSGEIKEIKEENGYA